MTPPALADAEKAISDAARHLAVARESGDEAVRADRYRQASQLLGHASRILDGLVPPDASSWGTDLVMPGARPQVPVFGGRL
jgi:hypothetical protein